ncbi:hypothetical protein KFK09_000480 [Dendrobium nobile]|uniref:DUF4283 domain-containing protein n=1 Tax=Dendrobium nobile TaxID=94219 RepID=A0A8T3CC01_DENNO|nr:hypothetical protein KFK09_000480 [Dendrobium nobile]
MAPVWIRMPNLSFQWWDEVNVCRIASMVGTPYLIDGNMFQWERREFARIFVRIKLDDKLPLGVWVEGSQVLEGGMADSNNMYGHWVHIKYGKGRFKNKNFNKVWTRSLKEEAVKVKVPIDIPSVQKISEVAEGRKDPKGEPTIHIAVIEFNAMEQLINVTDSTEIVRKLFVDSGNVLIVLKKFGVLNQVVEEGEILCTDKVVGLIVARRFCNQGARKKNASLYLKEIVKDHGVFFVGLIETKLSSIERREIDSMICLDWQYFQVPSEGLSGGILVLWKDNFASFNVLDFSSQLVIGELDVPNKGRWRLATIYVNKDVYRRRLLWEKLELFFNTDLPLVIGVTSIVYLLRRTKGEGKDLLFSQVPKEMKSFLPYKDLHDVGCVGPRFIWCNNKVGAERILE